MGHYVQYHNVEMKGELRDGDDTFDAWTDKVFANLIGSTIWLIMGEGKSPRKYYLAYRFIVDAIDSAPPNSGKEHRPYGHDGVRFRQRIRLDDLPWWPEFLKSQGRFGFGLNPIQATYVEKLEALTLLKSVTREQALHGMERFDKEWRPLPRWRNWQGNLTQKYALDFEGQWYPPKMVVSLGTGISRARFSGGIEKSQANGRLEQLGFRVIPIPHHGREYLRPDESEQDEQQQSALDSYVADGRDTRELVERTIRIRRGQQAFRSALRNRYGDACLISGCELLDVLEAAHIEPYRGMNDHQIENGLLLRADLHTLFDLDLIGIEPETLTVRVHPRATAGGYGQFDGQRLRCSEMARPSKHALRRRWRVFKKQD